MSDKENLLQSLGFSLNRDAKSYVMHIVQGIEINREEFEGMTDGQLVERLKGIMDTLLEGIVRYRQEALVKIEGFDKLEFTGDNTNTQQKS